MEHRVEGEREAELLGPRRNLELSIERREAGDAVRGRRRHILNRELHGVEPQVAEAPEPLPGQRNAARDEVRVQLEAAGMGDQRLEVATNEGLAPGEIELDDAQVLRLGEDAKPVFRFEL